MTVGDEIAIGVNQFLGRIICECGWHYYIKEDDIKEDVEAISWDHYHDECGLRE